MNNAEMKKADEKTLREHVEKLRKEYFDMKLSKASTPVKDNSQFRKIRASIARALTYLNEK